MYFNAHLKVTIGNKLLQTVEAVSVSNDSSQIGSYCDIVVPTNCRIQYQDGKHDYLTDYPKNLFSSGDAITVQAWYDGYPILTVFTGFVVDFIEGTPTKIKCTDSLYLLNQSILNLSYKSISLKDLISNAIKGTGVTLLLPTLEMQLVNISFRMMSPAAILEWLKKEIGINISLSGTKLYVNVASNTLNTVKLRTDRNVLRSEMQKPATLFQKYKVKAWFIRENGTKDSYEVGDPNGHLREVFFYKIPFNVETYKRMANEALKKVIQQRYNGSVTTMLYPECDLFYRAEYVDIRYPARSANYVIIGRDIEIDGSGYRQKLKLAFISEIQ